MSVRSASIGLGSLPVSNTSRPKPGVRRPKPGFREAPNVVPPKPDVRTSTRFLKYEMRGGRSTARIGGMSSASPMKSVMNPGVSIKADAKKIIAPSANSFVGSLPVVVAALTRRMTPRPSRFTSQAPTMLTPMTRTIVGNQPSWLATCVIMKISMTGTTMKARKRYPITSISYDRAVLVIPLGPASLRSSVIVSVEMAGLTGDPSERTKHVASTVGRCTCPIDR